MVDINKILALIVSVDFFVQHTAFCFVDDDDDDDNRHSERQTDRQRNTETDRLPDVNTAGQIHADRWSETDTQFVLGF